jgi:cytochrome c peroxidase
VACHTGPALNSTTFHALGMPDLAGPGVFGEVAVDENESLGRGSFTGLEADSYKFKTPQLYNLKDSPFLGHGGTFNSVREVIEYKNRAEPARPSVPASRLAEAFRPLGLTPAEVEALDAFVSQALYDPDLARYQPASLPSGNCFPVNDAQSRVDLGCN